ncbi:RDD family protein [Streptomyces sp. NPDC017405]|uniref:RDD family protein n=1 Tax=unclassified Streptomyces TaxID=2593676 RepID=UPI00378AA2F7
MSELVTGEAVALELRPAKLPSRALAVLLDLAAAMAAYIVVFMVLVAATASLDEAAQVAVSIAAFLLVLVGGPVAVETLSHGRSLGKLAFGLRVVRDDGGPIRFRHALVRGAVGVVEILMTLGVVACIASLVSARGRRLGDVFAGTLVVRERVPAGRTGFVPPPPPWLAGRFAGLDLSAVPDGLWLAVRQYLARMGQLDPGVSAGMARRLADDLAGRAGARVPPELPSAAFLAAVLHERQSREARQAFGPGGAPAGVFGPPTAYQQPQESHQPQEVHGHRSGDRQAAHEPYSSGDSSAAPAAYQPPRDTAPGGRKEAVRDESRSGPPATGFAPPG